MHPIPTILLVPKQICKVLLKPRWSSLRDIILHGNKELFSVNNNNIRNSLALKHILILQASHFSRLNPEVCPQQVSKRCHQWVRYNLMSMVTRSINIILKNTRTKSRSNTVTLFFFDRFLKGLKR